MVDLASSSPIEPAAANTHQGWHSLVTLVQARAQQQPDRTIFHRLTFPHSGAQVASIPLTYHALDAQVRAVATQLQAAGAVGERVLLLYPFGFEFITAFLGALYAGAVAVPLFPPRQSRPDARLRAIAADAAAAFVLTTPKIANAVAERGTDDPLTKLCWLTPETKPSTAITAYQPHTPNAGDLALLQYTSGSTGQPKGVMISHGNLLHNAVLIQRAFAVTPASRGLMWTPFYHDMGLVGGLVVPLCADAETWLIDPVDFLQQPSRWLQAISEYQITISGGPDFAYNLCVDKIRAEQCQTLDLSSWAVAFSGAEPIRATTLDRFTQKFASCGFQRQSLTPSFGLAESTVFVTSTASDAPPTVIAVNKEALTANRVELADPTDPIASQPLVSSGHTWLDHHVTIVEPESGRPLPEDAIGEIWISGPSVAKGYWQQPALTAETFHGALHASPAEQAGTDHNMETYLRSGDLGFLHKGELFVTGRRKDLMIIRGRNYYPQDIEQSVEAAHEALRTGCCAAFSIEREGMEQLVVVQEIERTHLRRLPISEVIQAIRQAVAVEHQLQLHAIVLLRPGRILKTTSGKIQRSAIKNHYLAGTLHYEYRWYDSAAAESIVYVENSPMLVMDEADGAAVALCSVTPLADESTTNPLLYSGSHSEQTIAALSSMVAQSLQIAPTAVALDRPLLELGLDSIGLADLARRIEQRFAVAVPLHAFFDEPITLATLALMIEAHGATTISHGTSTGEPAVAEPLTAGESGSEPATNEPLTVPLLPAQRQLWFLSQFSEDASLAYNETVTLQLQGNLDIDALATALQWLVDRHSALRTVIDAEGDCQQILPHVQVALPYFELQDSALEPWLAAESQRPFVLSVGPLIRAALIKITSAATPTYLLVITVHHIVIDGLSFGRLLAELRDDYQIAAAGEGRHTSALPMPMQFHDYVARQLSALCQGTWAEQQQHWLAYLHGPLPILELPLDYPRLPLQSYRGALHTITIDADLTAALNRLSHDANCTLFMTLFAAYTLFLHRLTGQDEVIVGVPAAGRNLPNGEQIVGYCTHLLPLRHSWTPTLSFTEFLLEIRAELLVAYANQDYPFAELVNQLDLARDFSQNPVINTTFNLLRQSKMPPFGELTATLGPRPTRLVDYDLSLNIIEEGNRLIVDFEYNTDLFAATTIARFANHFATLLTAIAATPTAMVASLPLLSNQEYQQIAIDWNETATPLAQDVRFATLFAEQVAATPAAIAARCGAEKVTYRELADRVAALAQSLAALGVGNETLVALLFDRSIDFLVTILALFENDAAYLPLDVRAPAARQAQVLAQSRTPLLLITTAFADLAHEALNSLPEDARPHIMDLATLNHRLTVPPPDRPPVPPSHHPPSPLAYVIYTSGSTGLPKGAMVEQRGMMNHLYAKIHDLALTATDIVAQTAPQSFDISVWQFLCPLLVGGQVHIFPDEIAHDPVALLEATAEQAISVLEVVPSLLRFMVDELTNGLAVDLSHLRWMIPTGEALPPKLARQWLELLPTIPLVNAYGPTECSDDVTHHVITEPPAQGTVNMPIGRPILNTAIYILDAARQPVPIGVTGELYVGGAGVGRGYLYDEERTAHAFVSNPFTMDPADRLYKTGDKARFLADGTIEYLGRLDHQVKIRGFRIELGEITMRLEQHPAVRQAIVVDRPDATGSKQLVAYIVPTIDEATVQHADQPTGPLSTILRTYLSDHLPDYMVPAFLITLDTMPLTPNGKVDHQALPQPDFTTLHDGTPFEAPQTTTQQALAAIWSEVLNLPVTQIGIHHDFFALGGHSLLATQAASRIRRHFALEIPLQTYFHRPTIAALAEQIDMVQWAATAATVPLAADEEEGAL